MNLFSAFLPVTALVAQPYTPPPTAYPPHVPIALLERAKSGDGAAVYDLIFIDLPDSIPEPGFEYWRKLCFPRLRAQAEQGNVEAMARLGKSRVQDGKTPEIKADGMDLLRRAADGGSLFAMDEIYSLMFKQRGDEKNQLNQPLKVMLERWWPGVKKRIENGDAEAMLVASRGIFRLAGTTDAEHAAWLDKAALELNHREALCELGRTSESDQKYDKALDCYERAAEQGHWKAALFGALLAISQQCMIEGDAYGNPNAAAAKGDELAKLAETNAGGRNDEINHYYDVRSELSQDDSGGSGGEEDGSTSAQPEPAKAPPAKAPSKKKVPKPARRKAAPTKPTDPKP